MGVQPQSQVAPSIRRGLTYRIGVLGYPTAQPLWQSVTVGEARVTLP
jgi:hypothetical protein